MNEYDSNRIYDITKKINYSPFYKILLSQRVADELELNKEMPFVDVIERKKNKSFVAKVATTHQFRASDGQR